MTNDSATDAVARTGIAYAFGDTKAVDGLDLTVREGEVFGLLGPDGAGKTTAIRRVTTLLPVPSGMVRVFGHDSAGDRMAVGRLIGYVPQQLSADSGLTGQAITMPLFFGSNALHPLDIMPGWLQAVSKVNPLSYEVDALRGLLLGTPAHLALDFGVLIVAAALGIAAASSLLGRPAR
ncbi:ATP-binding cassette domain-containing protein [Streptomyces zaehneri]|uniref:ATP-binding cassette domain-containing protein n=1 Tax=Streptomyces zaehneri TaxID=3051180 RepID=UPI0028D7EEB9|nr:ATP-binding cassette domain-containing protein [Streptomyces sp. DSM 40713]